jgi:hypothetical protein
VAVAAVPWDSNNWLHPIRSERSTAGRKNPSSDRLFVFFFGSGAIIKTAVM